MKAAYTGWTWLVNHGDNHKWEFEQALKEAADLGYAAVENFSFIQDYFDNNADEVAGLLKKYDLEMANLYLHFSDDAAGDFKKAQRVIPFAKKIGTSFINLQAVMWNDPPNDRPTDESIVKDYAKRSNEVGALCKENGIVACFHPHANTHVFTEREIDILMENTDPDKVSLCIDTAHTYIAGMDVVKAFEKFAGRIDFVHFKDVDPDESVRPEWPMARFKPLGDGVVDFKGVHKVLQKHGYDGVICVELDNPPVCNYKAAMVSARYLRDVIGIM